MNQKGKTRFMKAIVWVCVCFTGAVIVACYVAAWFGVSTDSVLTHTCAVFGGELLLTVVLRLMEDKHRDGKGAESAEDEEDPKDMKDATGAEDRKGPKDEKGPKGPMKKEDEANG